MVVNVEQLLELYGSPLYLYDKSVLEQRCNQMKEFCNILEKELEINVTAHYSTKSNSNPEILKIVEETGLNVDCMSPLELAVDEISGFKRDRMLYVCNNISAEEMKLVHDKDILICLDSISQVETWGKLFPNTEIMIRINPGVLGIGHSEKVITSGKSTKFGVSEENFAQLFKTANLYNLKIVGVHQHLGSLFLNDKIQNYIDGIKAGLYLSNKYFKDAKIIDLGGGFGVPYLPEEQDLDLKYLAHELLPIIKEFLQSRKEIKEFEEVKEIKFEPGRFIPCESGKIIGTVTAVKHENGLYWIGTDIGMNQLVRPSMYDAYHEINVISKSKKQEKLENLISVNFCGNICESGDILGKNRTMSFLPEVGDFVIVSNAGAYGYSMASNYTGRPRPAEVMIDGNENRIIRKRETIDHLLKNIT